MRRMFHQLTLFIGGLLILSCAEEKPTEPQVAEVSKAAYIFNGLAQTISIFDIEKQEMTNDVIAIGKWPNDIAIRGDLAYVVNSGDNSVQIIDLESNQTTGLIDVGDGTNPMQIVILNEKTAYVTALFTDAVVKVDLEARRAIKTIPVGARPAGIVVHDGKVYVANSNAVFDPEISAVSYGPGSVSVIDSRTDEVIKTIDVGLNPQYMAVDIEGEVNVVCTGNYAEVAGQVYVIDTSSDEVVGMVDIGGTPGRIAIAPNGKAFLGGNFTGLLAYDTSDNSIVHSAADPMTDFAGADGLAVDSEGVVYICVPDWTGGGKDKLLLMDSDSETLIASFTPGGGAQGVAIR